MVPSNGGNPSQTTRLCRLPLQLGSDFLYTFTRTGLTPSPARCNFGSIHTVFVIVFAFLLLYSGAFQIVKENVVVVQGKIKRYNKKCEWRDSYGDQKV